ncbi:hypothetical protein TELCIR_20443, partial [Teladorsagia circumcincta]
VAMGGSGNPKPENLPKIGWYVYMLAFAAVIGSSILESSVSLKTFKLPFDIASNYKQSQPHEAPEQYNNVNRN